MGQSPRSIAVCKFQYSKNRESSGVKGCRDHRIARQAAVFLRDLVLASVQASVQMQAVNYIFYAITQALAFDHGLVMAVIRT